MGLQRGRKTIYLLVTLIFLSFLSFYAYAAVSTSGNETKPDKIFDEDMEDIVAKSVGKVEPETRNAEGTETTVSVLKMKISYSDIILVCSSLFLGFCALIAPYVAEFVKRTAFAPKLEIVFYLSQPFCHKTMFRDSSGRIDEPVYYYRFCVVNKGKSQARKCEAVLENIWIYDFNNEPKKYNNISSVHMNWSISDEKFIDINPNRKYFCDLCHISSPKYQKRIEMDSVNKTHYIDLPNYIIKSLHPHSDPDNLSMNSLHFVLDLKEISYAQPNYFIPGKYVIQIGLYSENGGYQKELFEILWSGTWQENDDEMFKEMIIKTIDTVPKN